MADKIEPAMTPKQWKQGLANNARGINSEVWLCVQEYAAGSRHALAAKCLHGQPFGFTREDVEYLKVCATMDDHGNEYIGPPDERLISIAGRIAALLPPEKS